MTEPERDDRVERFYDEFWTESVWSGAEPNVDERMRIDALDRVIEERGLGGRILDVGCGRGCITAALGRHGEITGIDVVEAGIRRGRELFPELDLRHGELADLNATAAGAFDVVVSTEVIEHVPRPQQPDFVRELHRALGSEGTLLLTTPRGELQERWRAHAADEQPVEDWLTEPALDALLADAGFEVVERRRVGVYPITRWRVPLVISPVRSVAARVPAVRRLIDRAGIYQLVVARAG